LSHDQAKFSVRCDSSAVPHAHKEPWPIMFCCGWCKEGARLLGTRSNSSCTLSSSHGQSILASAGAAKVEITYHIDSQGVLNVTACDLNTFRQEQWWVPTGCWMSCVRQLLDHHHNASVSCPCGLFSKLPALQRIGQIKCTRQTGQQQHHTSRWLSGLEHIIC
jgi:hypothetical protein